MVSVGGGAGSDVAAALALRSFLQERRRRAALARTNSCARPHKHASGGERGREGGGVAGGIFCAEGGACGM